MANRRQGNSSTSKNKRSKSNTNGSFRVSSEPVVQVRTEGDAHKYEVSQGPQPVPHDEGLGELPRSYGENTLYLVARDPRWLFTYWDVNWSQFPSSEIQGGKVYLRVCGPEGEESRIEVNPEARNWYIPVRRAGTSYYVELGYETPRGGWTPIVRSEEAHTPSDALSPEDQAHFATVPLHLTFERLIDMVRSSMSDGETLIGALSRLQAEGRRLAFKSGIAPDWNEQQRQILATLFGKELVDQIGLGSAEIDQLLRKFLQEKLQSESASELAAKGAWAPEVSSLFSGIGLWGPEITSLFSAIGASWSAQPFSEERPREFFMHVNAEVVFYGGTHPDAKLTIAGQQIRLNPDGTFRFHFKFPDGNYEIPIVAEAPDKAEARSATLTFKRGTERKGDVGHTAQPEHLQKPIGEK
jgi:uncharacterized protein